MISDLFVSFQLDIQLENFNLKNETLNSDFQLELNLKGDERFWILYSIIQTFDFQESRTTQQRLERICQGNF